MGKIKEEVIKYLVPIILTSLTGIIGTMYARYVDHKEPTKPVAEKVATATQEAEATPSKKSNVAKAPKVHNTQTTTVQPAAKKAPVQTQVANTADAEPTPVVIPVAKPKPQQQAVVVQPDPAPIAAPVVKPQPVQQSSSNNSSIGDM